MFNRNHLPRRITEHVRRTLRPPDSAIVAVYETCLRFAIRLTSDPDETAGALDEILRHTGNMGGQQTSRLIAERQGRDDAEWAGGRPGAMSLDPAKSAPPKESSGSRSASSTAPPARPASAPPRPDSAGHDADARLRASSAHGCRWPRRGGAVSGHEDPSVDERDYRLLDSRRVLAEPSLPFGRRRESGEAPGSPSPDPGFIRPRRRRARPAPARPRAAGRRRRRAGCAASAPSAAGG